MGDYVDIRDYEYGVWYMGKIVKIKKDDSSEIEPTSSSDNLEDDGLIYFVEDAGYASINFIKNAFVINYIYLDVLLINPLKLN